MSWKEEIRKERFSDEHLERVGSMRSSKIEGFETNNVAAEVAGAVDSLKQNTMAQIESIMQKAQQAYMQSMGIDRASGIGVDYPLAKKISDFFDEVEDEILDEVNRLS
jgi:hypothetical protein|tara:strand:+ start:2570 stop:2893 length:324 start_codon:yes stop_codon:yes gene_type:complete